MLTGLVQSLQALMTEFGNRVIEWVSISKGTSIEMLVLNYFKIHHFYNTRISK